MDITKPLLVDTGKGFSIKYKNRNLYSLSDPEEGACKRVLGFTVPKESVVIVPSPLLGYGLKELKAKLPLSCHILCIETDQQLMSITQQYISKELLSHKDITFLRVDNPSVFARFIIEKKLNHYRKGVILPITGGFGLNRRLYGEFETILNREIQTFWQNKMTLIHMGRLWINNIFKNLPYFQNAESVSALKTDKKICLVGAGISLEDKINVIIEKRSELFILAVDTALPVLIDRNVVPDAVVAVEGQFYNLYDFYKRTGQEFPIICDITSYPGVLHSYSFSKIYLFASSFVENNLLKRLNEHSLLPALLPPMGSVGVISLYLALRMTRKAIITVGLDFAYQLGKTHAVSSYIHSIILKNTSRFSPPHYYNQAFSRPFEKIKTPDRHICTDPVLKSYARQFRNVIAGDDRVFNLGGFGFDLGIPEIDDIDSVSHVEQVEGPDRGKIYFHSDYEKVKGFLESELALVEECIDKGRAFLKEKKNSALDELRFIFEKVDYIFVGFPDTNPLNALREDFIARVVIGASFCRKSLLYAIKLLNSK